MRRRARPGMRRRMSRRLHLRGRSDALHPPDECVDCGACEPVCPVEAIFYEDDLPDKWHDYYQANVDFFDDLGSPEVPRRSVGPISTRPSWPPCRRRSRDTRAQIGSDLGHRGMDVTVHRADLVPLSVSRPAPAGVGHGLKAEPVPLATSHAAVGQPAPGYPDLAPRDRGCRTGRSRRSWAATVAAGATLSGLAKLQATPRGRPQNPWRWRPRRPRAWRRRCRPRTAGPPGWRRPAAAAASHRP
jgi:ferredoxin